MLYGATGAVVNVKVMKKKLSSAKGTRFNNTPKWAGIPSGIITLLTTFSGRFFFAALLGGALACAWAGDEATAPEFSRYPQTDPFQVNLQRQTNAAVHTYHILAVCEFGSDVAWASRFEVGDHGAIRRLESGYFQFKIVSETELAAVVAAIPALPRTNTYPPLEHLFLVSFHEGTNWVTHSYDKRTPPKAMASIFELRRRSNPTWLRSFTVQ